MSRYQQPTIDELWNASSAVAFTTPARVAELPAGARHYLEHAIAPASYLRQL